MQINKYIVTSEYEGMRIDACLSIISGLSRSNIQRLIDEKSVLLNGEVPKAKFKVVENDEITLYYEEPKEVTLKPVKMDLDIVYEDQDLIVINKPKGLVVHPAVGNYENTLVHGLLYHCKDLSGINGEMRPGIVHRIDKDTSGLLVCAKNNNAHISLSSQLQDKTCFRKYYAICHGVFEHDEGTIDAPIGRDEKDRQKMSVTLKNSKEAITHFKVLKRF
ncbi:MAG: RluA family pseudouridine synthase, partial [Erysipelotrichaceae bacterium]